MFSLPADHHPQGPSALLLHPFPPNCPDAIPFPSHAPPGPLQSPQTHPSMAVNILSSRMSPGCRPDAPVAAPPKALGTISLQWRSNISLMDPWVRLSVVKGKQTGPEVKQAQIGAWVPKQESVLSQDARFVAVQKGHAEPDCAQLLLTARANM